MRIAYVDPHPVPGPGNEALQIAQNVDAFARSVAPIDLVTPQPARASSIEDLLGRDWNAAVGLAQVPDYRTRWWAPAHSNRMFFRAMRARLARSRPAAVWVRHLRCAEAILNMPAAPPVFFEAHEVFARSLAERGGAGAGKLARLSALEERVYRGVGGVIALTEALAGDLKSDYACTAPILVAPDGFDALLAAQARAVALDADPVILYIGSLHPWKGVDVALRAMRWVPRGTLVVVGGDERSIAPLRALADEVGVSGRASFVGAVPPHRRFDWIAAATVCLLPLSGARIASHYTSPLKLFEYLALGKPVVAANLPSIREVVEHRRDAWLVEPGEPEQLAAAIRKLLDDGALRRSLGEAARRTAAAHSWDARAQSIHAFIAGCLAGAPR